MEGKSGRDSALPRWSCQMCKHPFAVAGADSYVERISGMGSGSVLTASRMDHSFVVLPKQKISGYPPPRPRTGGLHYPTPGYYPGQTPTIPGEREFTNPAVENHGGRTMDGSFVVLPSAAASMYRNESDAQTSTQNTNNTSFNANVNVLTRVFEIASAQTQVDQPLCLECMRALSEELEKQVDEVTKDIKAYESCIERLEKEQITPLSEEEFTKEKAKIEEDERKLEIQIEQVLHQNQDVKMQLEEYDSKFKDIEEFEQRFWHDFNNFKLQLTTHQEERDAVLAKIDVAEAQLSMLKKTNVLNESFKIWYEREFGTINGFRLGRLPNVEVEWDEINAALGQSCLLLHTMAQYCQLNFTYRLIPMGSYSCIADGKTTYELFGPVNLFWSTHFDTAMMYFLACLKEFAEFARAKDLALKIPEEKCFKLPYKIEGYEVEGMSIRQSFNPKEKWTAALKYTLCDLKWALYWLIGHTMNHPSSASSLPTSSNAPRISRTQQQTV